MDKPIVDTDEVIRRIVARLNAKCIEHMKEYRKRYDPHEDGKADGLDYAEQIVNEESARAKRENEEAGHGE